MRQARHYFISTASMICRLHTPGHFIACRHHEHDGRPAARRVIAPIIRPRSRVPAVDQSRRRRVSKTPPTARRDTSRRRTSSMATTAARRTMPSQQPISIIIFPDAIKLFGATLSITISMTILAAIEATASRDLQRLDGVVLMHRQKGAARDFPDLRLDNARPFSAHEDAAIKSLQGESLPDRKHHQSV